MGKLSGVSQARGEGHLAGEKAAHLLWETGQEGSGEQTWRKKPFSHLDTKEILNQRAFLRLSTHKSSRRERFTSEEDFVSWLWVCIPFNKFRQMGLNLQPIALVIKDKSGDIILYCIFFFIDDRSMKRPKSLMNY